MEVKYVGSWKRKAVELKEEYNVKQEKRDKALADMYTSLATKTMREISSRKGSKSYMRSMTQKT